MKKLAIILSHPIQYYAPIFQLLTQRNKIQIKVFYTWSQSQKEVKDNTFGQSIQWDIPLLEGYDFQFIENTSSSPGTHHRNGIICPSLNHEIELWKPDALLVYGWIWKAHHKALKYFKGKIPVLFRGDSNLLDEKPGLKKLMRRMFLTRVYKNIDTALYVGTNNKAYYKAHGIKRQQLHYAPHAIDNQRFANDSQNYKEKAMAWRKELGYKENDYVVVFAGKFESKKNPLLLIEAIKELQQEQPIHLLLIGNGPQENLIDEQIKGNAYIQKLGFQNQSQMPLIYRLGQVYCLPSQGPGETWGLAVNEALASGRPVIVSDKVGCASDVVQNGKNGNIFQSNNKEQLKQSILDSMKNNISPKTCQDSIEPYNFNAISKAIEEVTLKLTT